MAIDQAICTVFKQDLMNTTANLEANTLKLALYTSSASLDEYLSQILVIFALFHGSSNHAKNLCTSYSSFPVASGSCEE